MFHDGKVISRSRSFSGHQRPIIALAAIAVSAWALFALGVVPTPSYAADQCPHGSALNSVWSCSAMVGLYKDATTTTPSGVTVANGRQLIIVCWASGRSVTGPWGNATRWWYKLQSGDPNINGKWISDAYVWTNTAYQPFGPQCGGSMPTEGAGTGIIVSGRAACFGGYNTASGINANLNQGIAVRRTDTMGGWWSVRFPNDVVLKLQQIDWGPADSTGRNIDVSVPATRAAGYQAGFTADGNDCESSSITDVGTVTATYLGK